MGIGGCCGNAEASNQGDVSLTKILGPHQIMSVQDHQMGNGSIYTGQMKQMNYDDGRKQTTLFVPHGHGRQHWEDGSKYDGEWMDGKAEGRGTFVYQNGDVYNGSFKADKACGYGTYTHASG